MGILQRVANFKSNNEFEMALRTSTDFRTNLELFANSKIKELPSIDLFCYFFQKLDPNELHSLRRKMFNELERKKFFNKEEYLLLAIDGVQSFSTKRAIEHSIYKDHSNGERTYHQYFLEAKVLMKNGIVLSLDSETIENPTTDFDKQDCELKAAKRLLERIHNEHPHLKFLLLGDALYTNSTIMGLCNLYKWKYALTFKGETKYPKLNDEINAELNTTQRRNKSTILLKKSKNTELNVELQWCNNLEYELNDKPHNINYIFGKIVRTKNDEVKIVAKFSYLINEETSEKNVLKKFQICRERWKIENQGFNFQKNNILHIGHNFSSIGNAGYNFYLLAQIAHTLIQLASYSDLASNVIEEITKEPKFAKQTLYSIFKTFATIAYRLKIELLEKEFRPIKLVNVRARLKLA